MSLINSVLRDLDKRRAGDGELAAVPNEVRPLPEGKDGGVPKTLIVLLAATALTAVGAWLALPLVGSRDAAPVATPAPPPVPAPAVATPAVPPAPTPAPPQPAADSPAPLALGSLRLDASLDRLPAAPPREKAKDAKKAEPKSPSAAPVPLPPIAKPVPESPPAARPAAVEPVPPKPAKPVVAVEDDWVRAQTLLRDNRVADAEPLLRQILQKNPGQSSARQALLGVLLPVRRHAEAIEVLREGLAQTPEQTGWAINLARLQADRNDYPGAWETLSRSLPHAQQQADFLAFCGTVLQRLNRSGEAVTYYQGALRLKPQEGRWWVGLGIALESERKAAEAREAYQRARAQGNLSPELSAFVDQKLR